MQPIDPADKRRPYVKVAASIRAAILTGELPPGSQLPGNRDLAELFEVSRGTAGRAVDTLQEEGFVLSRPGSGVYVKDQASLPVSSGDRHPLTGTAHFLFEMGHLKALPRAGWLRLGIPQPESVAEHSFRATMAGITLAAVAGADIGRTAALCAFHDGHETRVGDVDAIGRAYTKTATPQAVTTHQVSGMPDEAAKALLELTAEYEANQTPEARLAHDADKIELLLQAREYEAQGYNTTAWCQTSVTALRTDEGRELARAISATPPAQWFDAFNASYHELRAATRARNQQGEDSNRT